MKGEKVSLDENISDRGELERFQELYLEIIRLKEENKRL